MALRPPSTVVPYDDFYTGDPAIVKRPADGDAVAIKEWERRIAVARETGKWDDVIVAGLVPCRFTFKPISGTTYRELLDDFVSKKIGTGIMNQIAFRAAIQKIVDQELMISIDSRDHSRYGALASVDVTDQLDAIGLRIVSELGAEVIRRAADLSPK